MKSLWETQFVKGQCHKMRYQLPRIAYTGELELSSLAYTGELELSSLAYAEELGLSS